MKTFITLVLTLSTMAHAGIAIKDRHWHPGSTIRVKLVGGNEAERRCLRLLTDDVERVVDLRFRFVTGPWRGLPHVTLTLGTGNGRGESTIGNYRFHRERMSIFMDQAVSAGAFSEETCRAKAQGPVHHEFGHFLGLKHEHQHPGVPDRVSDAVRRSQGDQEAPLPAEAADDHILTPYDITSVMHYGFIVNEPLIESLIAQGGFEENFRATDDRSEFWSPAQGRWLPTYSDYMTNAFSPGDIHLLQSLYGAPGTP